MPLFVKAALIWLGFVLMAGFIGALCDNLLALRLGPRISSAIGNLLLSGMIFALTLLWLPHLAPLTARGCWAIGCLWVGLTLVLVRLVARFHQGSAHQEWSTFTEVRLGNLMLLVLLVTLVAPYLAARLLALI
jgi:hypothetical protein